MRARILNASAGSGKTYQLAYKYVRDVVEQPTLYRHILAVTFTNKATEEMRSRILSEIHTLASGGKSGYLASLCAELSLDERTVRTRAREAGPASCTTIRGSRSSPSIPFSSAFCGLSSRSWDSI
ncbi:MAG: UvrD-helicase domain-containing protein [Alistipes putredinis]